MRAHPTIRVRMVTAVAVYTIFAPNHAVSRQDLIEKIRAGDPTMTAAFAQAAATRDAFLALARNPPEGTNNFAVKIGLADSNIPPGYVVIPPIQVVQNAKKRIEWVWITDFEDNNGDFSGVVNNTPVYIHNIQEGQTIHFHKNEIGDWLYLKGKHLIGDVTGCAATASTDIAQRKTLATYGLTCP